MFTSLVISLYKKMVSDDTARQGQWKTAGHKLKRTRNKIYTKSSSRHCTHIQLVNILYSNQKYFFFPYHLLSYIEYWTWQNFFLSYYISFNNFLKTKFLFTWFRVALFRPEKFEFLYPDELLQQPTKMLEKLYRGKEVLPIGLKICRIKVTHTIYIHIHELFLYSNFRVA